MSQSLRWKWKNEKREEEGKNFVQKLSKLPFHILIVLEISNSEIVNFLESFSTDKV